MNEQSRTLLAAQLNVDEGRRKRVYKDTVGKLTGGVGRNLTDRDFSEDEIDLMLRNDIAIAERDLSRNCPWWTGLSEVRQEVLANMCFNLGIGKLLEFKKFLGFLQSGRWDAAANEMLDSQWAKQVGDRALRLAKHMREG